MSASGLVTWKENVPKMRGVTISPSNGSSMYPSSPPNGTLYMGRMVTKKRSVVKTSPPVNLSTRLLRKGMFWLLSVWRCPAPAVRSVPTTDPSRKNTDASSASTVSCEYIGMV